MKGLVTAVVIGSLAVFAQSTKSPWLRLPLQIRARDFIAVLACALIQWSWPGEVAAQVPPTDAERAAYTGLHAAAWAGDAAAIRRLLARSADPKEAANQPDAMGRTPLHVAAFAAQIEAMRALVDGGADPNARERDRYDIVTIAAVANDLKTLTAALALGCKPTNITSRYDGTALIAAAHLGHHEVVEALLKAGAPVNHVNNLGWTALIESIALGDGGDRHQKTLALLLAAGADINQADLQGALPIALARALGYREMVKMLEGAERR